MARGRATRPRPRDGGNLAFLEPPCRARPSPRSSLHLDLFLDLDEPLFVASYEGSSLGQLAPATLRLSVVGAYESRP